MYELLLLVGGLGFLAMTLLGLSHGNAGGGHGHGTGHVSGIGHGHGHAPAIGHGHGHGLQAQGIHTPKGLEGAKGLKSRGSGLLFLLSPVDIFALSLGAGATGVLLKHAIAPGLLIWAAVAGAIVLDFLLIRPVMGFAMRFASKPSKGLEGAVYVIGNATTTFDSQGQGLVQLALDGQLVQLLAKLDAAEQELGETVAKGDSVTILAVDAKRNTCLVSKLPPDRNP